MLPTVLILLAALAGIVLMAIKGYWLLLGACAVLSAVIAFVQYREGRPMLRPPRDD